MGLCFATLRLFFGNLPRWSSNHVGLTFLLPAYLPNTWTPLNPPWHGAFGLFYIYYLLWYLGDVTQKHCQPAVTGGENKSPTPCILRGSQKPPARPPLPIPMTTLQSKCPLVQRHLSPFLGRFSHVLAPKALALFGTVISNSHMFSSSLKKSPNL